MAHSVAMEELQLESENADLIEAELPRSFHQRKRELYEKFKAETDAFYAASRALNDGVILPSHTRDVIGNCLDIFDQDSKFLAHLKKINVTQPLIRM